MIEKIKNRLREYLNDWVRWKDIDDPDKNLKYPQTQPSFDGRIYQGISYNYPGHIAVWEYDKYNKNSRTYIV